MLAFEQLKKKYSLFFSNETVIVCHYGWQKLLEDFCAAANLIVSNGPYETFIIHSMKEKYGVLMIDYTGGDDLIKEIVDFTEILSYTVCELCGSEGKLYAAGRWNNWSEYKTLCKNHAIQLQYYEIKLKKGIK